MWGNLVWPIGMLTLVLWGVYELQQLLGGTDSEEDDG